MTTAALDNSLPHKPIKRSDIVRYILLTAAAVAFLIPLYIAVMTSFKTAPEVTNSLALPQSLYLGNYAEAWARLARPTLNTLFITVPGVVLSVLIGCIAAYPLSQMKMKHGRVVYIFLLLGMFVPFQIVQIPIFFLIRSMGLYNQFAGMWLVHMAYGIPFCTFFMRNFFATVPRSMYEAAAIDGCSPAGYFFKILMPASVSGLAALTIVQSRGIWNDLLFALTLTSNANARPVTLELYGMVGTYDLSEGPLMASAIVSTLPVIIVFLIFQKAFTRGLLGGGSK